MPYDAVLGPDDVLSERPFCDAANTVRETEVMRSMLALERERVRAWPDEAGSRVVRERDVRGRRLLLVVPDPGRLLQAADLTAVGFFSRPREAVDHAILFKLEDELVGRMGFYGELGLLSYFDLELDAGGPFGNLILFSTPDVPEAWYRDGIHRRAVELSPAHYHEIRLHKGSVRGRLLDGGGIEIERTKYFDFASDPPWLGLREFDLRAPAR